MSDDQSFAALFEASLAARDDIRDVLGRYLQMIRELPMCVGVAGRHARDQREDIALDDIFANLLHPADEQPFRHVEAEFGHVDSFSHYFKTSFTAATISGTCGSAACSRVRL